VAQIEVVTYLPAKVGVCRVCDLADALGFSYAKRLGT